MTASLDLIEERLHLAGRQLKRRHDKIQAQCPAHDDHDPSLTVNVGERQNIVLHCHAGCETTAVLDALNLSWKDICTPQQVQARDVHYVYTDQHGRPSYRVVRNADKKFWQQRLTANGEWVSGLGDTPRVLYRLPAVLRAVDEGRTVYVVEGEKDADAVARIGECGTTNPGGAGNFGKVADAPEVLRGAHVVVVADRDEPGRKHAADVVRRLEGVAASVTVRQAASGKDISDHLAAGHTLDQLEVLELDGDDALQGDDTPAWNLPASFWQARPVLAHIRQAAHNRARSADAVLGAVLARVSAMTPPTVTLPAVVGVTGSLNVSHGIVGPSGAGKSTSVRVAGELCPWPMGDDIRRVKPSSGEGLVEKYFTTVTEDGKRVKRQTCDRLFVDMDEGQALVELGGRKGNILLPVLREAWTGGDLGQSGASTDTTRQLDAHTYRMAVIIGLQLEYAADIVGDAAGGTPQRFVWFAATDPTVPYDPPPWPGALDITPPPAGELDLHPDIWHRVRRQNVAGSRGDETPDPLDAHANLVRLKLAGLLAILDGRRGISLDDWTLADTIWTTSTTMRDRIIATGRNVAAQREAMYTDRAVRTQQAVTNSAEQRALDGMARAIARRVHRSNGEPVTRRELHASTKPAWRQLAALDEAIAVAEGHGWIRHDGERWTPGTSRPS